MADRLTTEALLKQGMAALGRRGLTAAGPGDLVALCTDARRDTWVACPVAADRGGVVDLVLWHGGACRWRDIADRREIVVILRSRLVRDGFEALFYREFSGLRALREALRPYAQGPEV